MNLKDYYRLVICGDSISKGIVFDECSEKYVVAKESFTEIIKKDFNGEIYNVGKFGNTILRASEKLETQVLQKQPDIVLLEFGGNDCDFDWEEIARNPFGEHNPKTNIDVFRQTMKNTIEILRSNGIVPVLLTLPPLDAERYFKWVSKDNSLYAQNILKWLGTVSKIYWWHEKYNSAVNDVAEETNTRLIDVRGNFLKEHDFRPYICVDGIHPNESGHQLIANKIIEYTRRRYSFLMKKNVTDQAGSLTGKKKYQGGMVWQSR